MEKQSLSGLADTLVKEASSVMRQAKMEEELRIGFEKALDPILKRLGITSSKYERGTVVREYKGKRPDAVHGKVIVEYEPPRSFVKKGVVEHAYEQLRDYLAAESYVRGEATASLFERPMGVGFDGEQIFFVRFKDDAKATAEPDNFFVEGPYPFDPESARTFLIHLRGLSRKPLTPENLAEIFGPESALAPKVVSAFAHALEHWGSERVRVFFKEWKRLFGIVYGEQFDARQEEEAKVLSALYHVGKETDFQELLFSVHTYFAYLMKLIAVEILSIKDIAFEESFAAKLVHLGKDEFKQALEDIENGGIYARRGITNLLEGDFFRWYLDTNSLELQDALREVARALSEFEPATTSIHPTAARDLLKKLYQYLVPQQIRHQLGEYYTPDWLAELVIDEVGYKGSLEDRALDPACGSGTFLVLAIQRAREWAKDHRVKDADTARLVLQNIWGFDLNPLAVIASRVNYLFALGDLINTQRHIEIPVYLADSVLTPKEEDQNLFSKTLNVPTSVGLFHVPAFWVRNKGHLLLNAAPVVEELVKSLEDPKSAMARFKKEGLVFPPDENAHAVGEFYNELLALEKAGKNGIWARFLKNTFAPTIAGHFDYVIGNPPWIRWDYLAKEYREATIDLWKRYGLFSLKGYEARLGGGKKDFAMLFVYASVDRFLKKSGKLGFLITQELFKSKGAGEGFRRFRIGEQESFQVLKAHDLVNVQPFEGAANKTAAIFLRRGGKTEYPVPYILWTRKKGVGRIPTDTSYENAMHMLTKKGLEAQPIESEYSSWQTLEKGHEGFGNLQGTNAYQARSGAYTSPYGVFWIHVGGIRSDQNLLVSNVAEAGKREIPQVQAVLEPNLVYPVIRGSDIQRWHANGEIYALITQDPKKRCGYDEERMKSEWPRTYAYLSKAKEFLISQAAYKKYHEEPGNPFYSQYNVAEYTFQRYKVVWKQMTNDIYAAVISQQKTDFGYKALIPLHTTAFFSVEREDEAHYLCAFINSESVRDFIKSYSSAGRGFGTPSVMKHVAIPKFDPKNLLHAKLAKLSKELHSLVAEQGHDSEISTKEGAVDVCMKELFA